MIWPNSAGALSLNPAEVAAKESAVRANPEDLDTRMELLVYYGYNDQPRYCDHLLWLIWHHPDIETLSIAHRYFGRLVRKDPAFADEVQSAWADAMTKYPGSPVVTFNAASFLATMHAERSLELLLKARAMDDADRAEKYDEAVATIYEAAEVEAFHPNALINDIELTADAGARLRERFQSSVDPELLSHVGKLLVELSAYAPSEELKARGFQLIQQAIQLDPGNANWREAREWAESEPQRKLSYENAERRART